MADQQRPTVSVVGLGAMGLPMARHIAAAREIRVWNRTFEKTALVEGAAGVPSLREAAADVVVTVLPDLVDVRDVLRNGLLDGFDEGGFDAPVLVVCGTVSPVALRELAEELDPHGVTVVDAPISGGVRGAAEGRLSVMVGGSPWAFDVVRDVLRACASKVIRMGDTGAGATAKLCNQIVVAETVVALSEAFALARTAGIDAEALADALGAGLANSEVLAQKRHHWIDETFEPGGTVAYQTKDLRYASETAAAGGLALDAMATARALFERAVDAGDGGLDHTGVYRTISTVR